MPRDRAVAGLAMIKDAISGYLRGHPTGATNTDIANALDLESYSSVVEGRVTGKNFLSHAVLGVMVRNGEILKDGKRYFHPNHRQQGI